MESTVIRILLSFQVADLIASEFFEQGDMEKLQLKIKPIVSFYMFCSEVFSEWSPTQIFYWPSSIQNDW